MMFHTLKGKLLLMQDGISASIRGLKIKDEKPSCEVPYVNFDAGVEILLKNEIEWSEIHSLFETNAHKAEIVDKKISEIHSHLSKQLHWLQEMNSFATNIPKFVKKVESISEELATLSNAIEEVEEFLVMFEDLVETEEYRQKEVDEEYRYNAYVKKKALEVEFIKQTLEEEYCEKLLQKEKQLQNTLKERQELFNMAFQQDMQLYKESGIIPNLRSNETTSKISLEDVVIDDDLEGLNELLNS